MAYLSLPNIGIPLNGHCLKGASAKVLDSQLKGFDIFVQYDDESVSRFSPRSIASHVGNDFARILSFGSRFRFESETIPSWMEACMGKKFSRFLRVRAKWNRCSRITFGRMVARLRDDGWLLRKDDKTLHWWIIRATVERRRLAQMFIVDPCDSIGVLSCKPYTLVKKGGIASRPIMPVKGSNLKSQVVSGLSKRLRAICQQRYSISECSMKDSASHSVKGMGLMTGDVVSMFPSVDINVVEQCLHRWFWSDFTKDQQDQWNGIFDEIRSVVLEIGGSFWRLRTGIPQGYKASPLCASVLMYTCWGPLAQERRFLGGVARWWYVDDLKFVFNLGIPRVNVRLHAEGLLKEVGLTVEWHGSDMRFTDSRFLSGRDWRIDYCGRINPAANGNGLIVARNHFKRIQKVCRRIEPSAHIVKLAEVYKVDTGAIVACGVPKGRDKILVVDMPKMSCIKRRDRKSVV